MGRTTILTDGVGTELSTPRKQPMRWRLNRTCVPLLVFIASFLGLLASMQAAKMRPKFKMRGTTVNLSRDYVAVKCQNGDKIREDRLRENAEVQAVSDPHDSKHIVAAWVGGQSIITSASFNGGKSWSAARPLRLNACLNPALSDYKGGADPGVGFGPGRTVYVSSLIGHRSIDRQAVAVSTSRDGGLTWDEPVVLHTEPDGNPELDNTSLAADPENSGFAYVATEFILGDATSGIGFSRTNDYGRTWSAVRPITPSVKGRRFSPVLVLEPDSKRLYGFAYVREPRRTWIAFIYSDDHGSTWSEPREITKVVPPRAETKLGASGIPFESAQDILRVAAAPKSGVLYVLFADARATDGNRLAISMISSSDRGKTWNAPTQVSSPSEGHAFQPALAVNSSGDVGVLYYDTRSRFPERPGKTLPISIWLRVLGTGGSVKEELLDQFNYAGLGRRGLLDYQSLLVSAGKFHAVYTKSNLRSDQSATTETNGGATDIYFH